MKIIQRLSDQYWMFILRPVEKIVGVHPRRELVRLTYQLVVGAKMPQDFSEPCVIITFKKKD